MNGVRKNCGVIRLLMAAALVLFVAACGGSGVKNDLNDYKDMAAELTAELEMVTAQLATVTTDRDQAQSDLMDTQGTVSDLNDQVSGLNGDIASLTTMRDSLTTMRDNLQMRVDTLTTQAGVDGMTISDLNDMITSLTTQAGVDGMTISDLDDMITSLTTQAGVDGMTISDLNDTITELNDMITSLTAQAGVNEMTISGLNDMITSLTTQAGVDGMTISDLNDTITELNDMITSLTAQAGVNEMTISGLNDMITSLTTQAGVDGMTISDLNDTITELNDMITSLTAQAGVDGMTISDLNDTITELNDMITSLTAQAGVDGMTISGLNDMITELNDTITDLTAQAGVDGMTISGLNDMITELNDTITDLTAQAGVDGMTISGLNDMITSLNDTITSLTAQAGVDGMTISGLNDMITSLNDTITSLTAQAGVDGMTISGLNDRITSLDGQITDLTGQLTVRTTERDDALGMLDAANTKISDLETMLADTNAELAKLKADLADEIAAAKAKKDSDAAKELFDALDTDPTNTDRLGAEPAPAVKVKASSGGVLTAEAEDFDAAGGADRISGMRGATLTMDDQTIVVYTDIENAKAREIGSVYRSAADPGKPAVYEVSPAGLSSTINWEHVTRADNAHTEEDDDGTAVLTFQGSVRGVDGSFTCSGTCDPPTATELDAHDTNPISNSDTGDWTFKPDAAKDTIDVADDDGYLMFGWWLDKGDKAEGPFKVDTFAMAPGMTANTADQAVLEGTATYTGGAAGKYAIKSTTADSAEGGHFTASARFAANFEAGDDDDMISIKGTIDDFMTGETARPNWEVTLTVPDFAAFQEIDENTTDAKAEWDTGGAVDGTGTWTANFWGEGDDDEPTAITGEFNAEISDIARLAGAFGATK